ncbi:hypothetical protein AVEN_210292-1 [Araneus ventricosus]|uniref:Uncharacterized protein n=1 Tax=Araneus ventricosus TaxID=182803 RepID=A0A4Y2U3C1_ARAVE|nr:hypothetical protein AVEN_210292-1 [Araneus ventricosus]
MNDLYNSSDIELGVLTAITDFPKGGTCRHRWSVTHYFCDPRRSESLLTYPRTRGACPSPVRRQGRRINPKILSSLDTLD